MRDHNKLLEAGNKAQREKLELPENQSKDDFDVPSIETLHHLLIGEVLELDHEVMRKELPDKAIENPDYSKIRHEAADVANFAHMIILKCDQELLK